MQLFNLISDFIVGKAIRNIGSSSKTIYLTFDDGPNDHCTPYVLDLLKKYDARASFFLIGNKIENNLETFNRIVNEGHAVGNHSLDHNPVNFVKGVTALRQWIDKTEAIIYKYSGKNSIGFRPPVGIRTPELRYLMYKNNNKPYLWQHRFYDTRFPFTDEKWQQKMPALNAGDIILLHDSHKNPHQFILALENFTRALIQQGYQLKQLPSQSWFKT